MVSSWLIRLSRILMDSARERASLDRDRLFHLECGL